MISIKENIEQLREKNLLRLSEEREKSGEYQKWYDDLSNFRKCVYNKYVDKHIDDVYRQIFMVGKNGDFIDHHTLSYLSPLFFKRSGWDGKFINDYEQIVLLSNWLKQYGSRLIYVPLPNKGVIYPNLLLDNAVELQGNKVSNSPQWRRFVNDVVEAGVETVDIFPVYENVKEKINLFSKLHHISGLGAEVVAEAVANYLRQTTVDIPEIVSYNCKKEMTTVEFEGWSRLYISSPFENEELSIVEPTKDLEDNIDIAIFGDCNLQAYTKQKAGVCDNLSAKLSYPVKDIGRHLIYDWQDVISANVLKSLKDYGIVIYMHFASAPFVRSSLLRARNPQPRYNWSNINLNEL